MNNNKINFKGFLKNVDPSMLDYQEWLNVGMALQHEGYSAFDWEEWSKRDTERYKPGECYIKWNTFNGNSSPVTGGTIVEYAKQQGYKFQNKKEDFALDWTDTISDELVVVDYNYLEEKELKIPSNDEFNPVKEIKTYIETLFEATDYVGYVTETYDYDGKLLPTKGVYSKTAGQILEELNKYNDIESVIGTYNKIAGAWVRFNPLDGKGVKNENVTDFRYALVESDNIDIGKQEAILRELELPIKILVYSGGKSVHAIVRIDANTYEEYRKRVDYLYKVCEKNGFGIDKQNRNPSRLSRLPGIIRGDSKQFIIDKNIGKSSFEDWEEWIEGVNDDLPEPESLKEVFNNLPELSPSLIDGVLRQGHKMLLAGPSKAGKSYLMIQLVIALAEGKKWLGWDCAKGKVLYVNLELDKASALHRFKDVYKALGYEPNNLKNIEIWNLRGKAVPMDKLAPKLIRRAQKKNYIAVVIDPIYKVITGDENSASEMANFTNQFDKVATELGCAVIYAHHHSKGSQGSKRSMDRASGSGVFARDPDALLDVIQLEYDEKMKDIEESRLTGSFLSRLIKQRNLEYYTNKITANDEKLETKMRYHAEQIYSKIELEEIEKEIFKIKDDARHKTAWRIEGTLREFRSFDPVNIWFKYPIHELDDKKVLEKVIPQGEKPAWQQAQENIKSPEEKKEERMKALEVAFKACSVEGDVTIEDLSDYLGVTNRTVWNRIKEHKGFETKKIDGQKESIVTLKEEK
ncbi:HTH domain-containing protein [Helcococcus ovis]|uniref:AAA family ATPase n=1 Tax=Helcococcus ovis TaxID=72026 RepID=UPI00106F3E88|nr:AAA family ATPase [Helcococcus ovis]TFF68343.1 HTH domain-containing protein [Helcococcus ovis]WNZ00904.1 AAA family ATPase [Helcococcus ovis]